MKRLAALLAAAAMVLAAVLVRGAMDSDEGSGGNTTNGSGRQGDLALLCGPELLAACNAIAEATEGISIDVQPEQETADLLASGELELGENRVWLAAGDWPAIATQGGANLPVLASSEVLARSPAVIVGRTERIDAARSKCAPVDWGCLGDFAGSPWTDLGGNATWGDVKVGLPDVAAASGMVTVNQAVASRVGSSQFATNDLAEPTVTGWFEHLARESGKGSSSLEPLAELIQVQGSLSMAGALEADAVRELRSAASAGSFTVIAPEPLATADVRLWAPNQQAVDDAIDELGAERLTAALSDTGWRIPQGPVDASPPAEAANIDADMDSLDTALPDTDPPSGSGLPSPGTIFTVNTRWRDSQ
jgi:hypothetical protein